MWALSWTNPLSPQPMGWLALLWGHTRWDTTMWMGEPHSVQCLLWLMTNSWKWQQTFSGSTAISSQNFSMPSGPITSLFSAAADRHTYSSAEWSSHTVCFFLLREVRCGRGVTVLSQDKTEVSCGGGRRRWWMQGWFIEQGLRLHQHSIGYLGDSFTGQKTQPTASK